MSFPNKRQKFSHGLVKRKSAKDLFPNNGFEYFEYAHPDLDEDTFSLSESAYDQTEDADDEIDNYDGKRKSSFFDAFVYSPDRIEISCKEQQIRCQKWDSSVTFRNRILLEISRDIFPPNPEPKISATPLTLYETCLITLRQHSKYIESLAGIPFIPYGADLLRAITKHESYLEPDFCRILGEIFHSAPDNVVDIDVTSLYLKSFDLKMENFQAIQGIGGILTRLNLSGTSVRDDEMRYLTWMTNLRVLDLSQTGISDRGLLLLTAKLSLKKAVISGLISLQAVNLAATKVSNLSIRHLLKFPGLVIFDISCTRADKLSLSMACRGWEFIPESVSVFCYSNTEKKEKGFIVKEISLEKPIILTNQSYIENAAYHYVLGSNVRWRKPFSSVSKITLTPIRMYRKRSITSNIKSMKSQSTPKLKVANEPVPPFAPYTIFSKTQNKSFIQKLTLSAALKSDDIQSPLPPTQPPLYLKPLGKIAPKRSHQLSFFSMEDSPKHLDFKKSQKVFRNPFMA